MKYIANYELKQQYSGDAGYDLLDNILFIACLKCSA